MEAKEMKKALILLIALMVISVGFLSGCEESKQPTITFTQTDKSTENELIVESVDPVDLDWSSLELQVDQTFSYHGMSGTVTVGDIIDISSIAGTSYYTISIRHIPTNILIASYSFTGWTGIPTLTFVKEDGAQNNKLTVVSVDPSELDWSDVELQVDGTIAAHGQTGTVTAGDILDLSALAGTGAYRVAFRHTPTNTLIGTYDFTAGTIPAPTVTFIKEDRSTVNKLTVISADPSDLSWSDLELQVNGVASDHGLSGTVYAGTIIDITSIAGTGEYTISLRHIPSNTLIGSYDFTAGTIPAPTVTFIKEDRSTVNKLTVISADPSDLSWSDLELQVNGVASDHGLSGTVYAGTIIDITSIAGTGGYTISLRYIPTNTLIGSWDFTGVT